MYIRVYIGWYIPGVHRVVYPGFPLPGGIYPGGVAGSTYPGGVAGSTYPGGG